MISIDYFKGVELKVGKVLSAERVEGSEKLLRLSVDLGEAAPRQILAGVGKSYDPETMAGRQVVIAANLEPRQMMGLESQGMVLATGDNPSAIALLSPDKEVAPGSTIR